jgi:hypothetical protein
MYIQISHLRHLYIFICIHSYMYVYIYIYLHKHLCINIHPQVRNNIRENKPVKHLVGDQIDNYFKQHRIGAKMNGENYWAEEEVFHIYMYIYMYTYIYIYVCMYTYIFVYIYMNGENYWAEEVFCMRIYGKNSWQMYLYRYVCVFYQKFHLSRKYLDKNF